LEEERKRGGFMPKLFNHNLIRTHIQNYHIDTFEEKLKVIQGWKKNLQTIKGTSEKALQSAFLQGMFGKVLGYKTVAEASDNVWTLNIETSTEVDATTPDAILGFYSSESKETQVVIELKAPKYSLDKKQKRTGKDYGSPVEQAFSYVSKYDRCKWVIVSNMIETRLYKVGRSQEYYENFFIDDLDKEEELKKFHFLLSQGNLIQKDGESTTYKLSERTKEHIQDISVKFYNLYKDIRIRLFEEFKKTNPEHDKEVLVEKAQKFLDRVIFICFCEDLYLLPNDLLHQAIQRGKNSFSDSDYIIWEEIKGVFRAIDRGSEKHQIPAYDGGLFAYDEVLDNLTIENSFFDAIYEISAYDFSADLDVNILGHIFEQSISDIETLKTDVQKGQYDIQQSRRKKEGIYYTPGYITKYIVENSLGKYLEEIRKELGEEGLPDIDLATTAQVEGRYRNQLRNFYQKYEKCLRKIKVLDPACGSGAFLNQAFDFLLEEYKWIYKQLSDIEKNQITVYNFEIIQRDVLQNNLYGVDINEESVEITKLSLWLKTADSKKALPYLDDNIKCGNSLIDDIEVAGDKSFNWNEEFPEIMSNGGFDVVIGNPPYIFAREKISEQEKSYYNEKYETTKYQINTYVLFIEKAIKLLRHYGYLGFIVPDAWLRVESASNLRKYMLQSTHLERIIRIRGETFVNVGVESSILILNKAKHNKPTIVNPNFPDSRYSNINQNQWLNNKEHQIDLYSDENVMELIKKIESPSWILDDVSKIKAGLQAYEKGKGDPKQSADDVKNRPYDYIYKYDESTYKYLEGRDIGRYTYEWNGQWLRYGKWLAAPRWFELFSSPRILVREIPAYPPRAMVATYIDKIYLNNRSIINVLKKEKGPDLKYILSILNSKLITFYHWNKSVKAQRDLFPKVTLNDLRKFPIKIVSYPQANKMIALVNDMLELKEKETEEKKKTFIDTLKKYASTRGISLKKIIDDSNFKNKIYSGRTQKVRNPTVAINDHILTIYADKPGSGKYELIKFEVKDYFKRQYLKLYLENLTEEQLEEVNRCSGNILEKVLQIEIPDYDKPGVIRRVVNEWNRLHGEIKELEEKIEKTDREIDQMVYELYGLNDDEIKIVEEGIT